MYANLHTLPAGQHMYTVYVGIGRGDMMMVEEVDVVASAHASRAQIMEASAEEREDFMDGSRVVGIVNASTNQLIWQEGQR